MHVNFGAIQPDPFSKRKCLSKAESDEEFLPFTLVCVFVCHHVYFLQYKKATPNVNIGMATASERSHLV
jgi:hypothetical protein